MLNRCSRLTPSAQRLRLKAPDGGTALTLDPLHSLTRNYSFYWDTSWIKPVWLYYKYYVISRLPPTYRNWRGYL